MLLAAIFVSPEVLGLYTWAILGLTLLQSIFDVAVRQVAVGALGSRSGLGFLRRYARVYAVAGPLVMGAIIFALLATHSPRLHASIWVLAPLLLAPLAMAVSTKSIAVLQAVGRWKTLASLQSLAVIGSLALSLPILLITRSIIGCVLQVTVVEVILAGLVTWKAGSEKVRLAALKSTRTPDQADTLSRFKAASIYSALGWGQGQSDRVLIGILAGTARLGQYNLAWSVSRSLGDAVTNATINVIRPKILEGDGRSSPVVERLLARATMLVAGTVTLTILGTEFILKPILGADWTNALEAVPIMALCTFPQVFAFSATIFLTKMGKLKWGIPAKILGLVLAGPIALAAIESLTFAAWLAVFREIVVMAWLLWLVRDALSSKILVTGGLWFAAQTVVVLLVS